MKIPERRTRMKNLFDLTGKKAIVTGAAQGLAYGMAEGLMEQSRGVHY